MARLSAAQIRTVLSHPAGWIASFLGVGFAPVAPGTFGSLAALVPYLGLREGPWWLPWLACALVFALGIWASDVVVKRLGTQDPGVIVIDEVAGQWLALGALDAAIALAPQRFGAPSLWAVLLVGFALFRICDIAKPWPASWADRNVHGGFGAMLDDVFAGVWAGALGIGALALAALV